MWVCVGIFLALDIAVVINELHLKHQHRHLPLYNHADPHILHEYLVQHKDLGWVNSPGTYPLDEGVQGSLTIWPNGQRASSPDPNRHTAYNVAVLGGTYTFGNGVRDQHTYCWLLNEHFPHATFHNYGVHEYGLYQCLATLEQLLSSPKTDLDLVIYSRQKHDRTQDLDDRYFMQPDATILRYGALDPQTWTRTLSYWRLPLEMQLLTISDLKMRYAYSQEKKAQQHRDSLDLAFSEAETYLVAAMRDSCAKHKVRFLINDLEEDTTILAAPLQRLVEKSQIDYFNNTLPQEKEKIPARHDTKAGYAPKVKFKYRNNVSNYSPNAVAHRVSPPSYN